MPPSSPHHFDPAGPPLAWLNLIETLPPMTGKASKIYTFQGLAYRGDGNGRGLLVHSDGAADTLNDEQRGYFNALAHQLEAAPWVTVRRKALLGALVAVGDFDDPDEDFIDLSGWVWIDGMPLHLRKLIPLVMAFHWATELEAAILVGTAEERVIKFPPGPHLLALRAAPGFICVLARLDDRRAINTPSPHRCFSLTDKDLAP